MSRAAIAGVVLALAAAPAAAPAQGYRVRLDARTQVAAFRGVQLDSVPVAQVQTAPNGGLVSPDGFAVRCRGANPFCHYFRAGPRRRGGPLTGTADFAVWGLGVTGLSVRGLARINADVGDTETWPGTDPTGELLEGYAEYLRGPVTAQAGRTQSLSRLGAVGFDGGRLTVRPPLAGLEASIYGGYSLARASALPLTSPALNPLDDYQPRERFLLAGAEIAALAPWGSARAVYQRQVDPRTDYFASERVGLDAALRPPVSGLSLSGGADYDMARGFWGSAEVVLTYSRGIAAGAIGARRYRPHFDLWTIWGVFSPVPFRAAHASLRVSPRQGLELSARGERYAFAPAEAETPLTDAVTDGWRWSAGARYAARSDLVLDGAVRAEYGPGAASRGFDASAAWQASEAVSLAAFGGMLERPLEFRFSESRVWMLGANADWRATPAVTLALGATRYVESRERPDPAAFDWNQVRMHLRASWTFGSSADRVPLPPAPPRLETRP